MMMKISFLLVILFAAEFGTSAKLKCFQLRFKLGKQQCSPKKGFEGDMVPCYNLCTKKLVKVEDCNNHPKNQHCCIHDCRCVMRGTGNVLIPPEYKLPMTLKKKSAFMKSEVQKGCTPKTKVRSARRRRPSLGNTRPSIAPTPQKRRNPMKAAKPKPARELIKASTPFPSTSTPNSKNVISTTTTTPCTATQKVPKIAIKFATKMSVIFQQMGLGWQLDVIGPCSDV
ncbi:uncharacterized protein LOC120334349 [Styela clava]